MVQAGPGADAMVQTGPRADEMGQPLHEYELDLPNYPLDNQ